MRLHETIQAGLLASPVRQHLELVAFQRRVLNLQAMAQCFPQSIAGPGLEAFNEMAKELFLEAGVDYISSGVGEGIGLEDFGSDTPLSISNEGFGEMLSKIKRVLFGAKTRISTKPEEGSADVQKFFKEAKKYVNDFYANNKWLDEQEFIEGDVKAADFSSKLMVGNQMPKDPLAQSKKDMDLCHVYAVGYAHELVNMVRMAVDYNHKGQGKSDEEVEKLFKELSGKLKQPTLLFPAGVSGNWSSPRKERPSELTQKTVSGPDVLPALTKDQVRAYANRIVELLDKAIELENGIIGSVCVDAFFDDTPPLGGYKHLDPAHILREFGPSCYPIDILCDVAQSFDKWINRSIK